MRTKLLHVFMIDFSPGWGVREHSHEFYQIWYVVSGSADYLLDGRTIHLEPQSVVFLRPGAVHELPPLKEGLLHYIDVQFQVQDRELEEKMAALPTVIGMKDRRIEELLLHCRDAWYDEGEYSRDIAALIFEQAVLVLIRQQDPARGTASFRYPAQLDTRDLHGPVKKMVDYLDSHYVERNTLDDLANVMSYSKAYLCKLFKEATGMTIISYLNYMRVTRAYERICYTNSSMAEIGAMVGFSSVHYFTRTFKKICGMTPGEVRNLQKDSILRDTMLHGSFNYRYYIGPTDRKTDASAADGNGEEQAPQAES